ncbi:hypothetical protein ASA1KI_27180 [Opitutales bacterium ASA1]|uniref:hypothetical protein n=1 Tax=Congregicoccus parvus TaxID=3081749 RepID=UPI002B30D929|nr:hypothetical protein ASA1KI_27180 [Opitutales bacterium ASA1]
MLSWSRLLLATLLLGSLAVADAAEPGLLGPGDTLPTFAGADQHGKPLSVDDTAAYVLVAFDMSTGKAANRFLADRGADFLPTHQAVFVSDIHGMPGVGRVFAMPKMRKYPHRILLADADGLLDPLPRTDGMITVFKLKPGRIIESVSFWSPAKDTPPF